MQVVKAVFLCILGFSFLTQTLVCHAYVKKQKKHPCTYEQKRGTPISDFVGGIIIDAASLLRNLFSVSSAKVLTGFTPLYVLTADARWKEFKSIFMMNAITIILINFPSTVITLPIMALAFLWLHFPVLQFLPMMKIYA